MNLKAYPQISKKISVSKSTVHVIKYANFELYRTVHILTELFGKLENWRQIYKQTSSTLYTSNDVSLRRVEEKKLLGQIIIIITRKFALRIAPLRNSC